jgi:hypothetical protein
MTACPTACQQQKVSWYEPVTPAGGARATEGA